MRRQHENVRRILADYATIGGFAYLLFKDKQIQELFGSFWIWALLNVLVPFLKCVICSSPAPAEGYSTFCYSGCLLLNLWCIMQRMLTTDQMIAIALPLIGAVIGYLFSFIGGFKDEFFAKRARVMEHELNVARHVLRYCHEASVGHFKTAPKKIDEVYTTATDVQGIDKKLGDVMNEFVSAWGIVARESTRNGLSADDVKTVLEQRNRAEENRVILVDWANKIRNGK